MTTEEQARLDLLIGKLEKATGPDRELDCLISAIATKTHVEWQGNCLVHPIEGVIGWADPGKHSRNFTCTRDKIGPGSIPAYSESLDAALSLARHQADVLRMMLAASSVIKTGGFKETPNLWPSIRAALIAALKARRA